MRELLLAGFALTGVLDLAIAIYFWRIADEYVFRVMALAYFARAAVWIAIAVAGAARLFFGVTIVPQEVQAAMFVLVPLLSATGIVGALYFGNGQRKR